MNKGMDKPLKMKGHKGWDVPSFPESLGDVM